MNIRDLIEELNECHQKYSELFPRYIKHKNTYEQLDDFKKDKYYEGMPREGTEELRKKAAETSPEYRKYKEGLNQARLERDKAYALVKPLEVRIESLRTVISALKQEVRSFGG